MEWQENGTPLAAKASATPRAAWPRPVSAWKSPWIATPFFRWGALDRRGSGLSFRNSWWEGRRDSYRWDRHVRAVVGILCRPVRPFGTEGAELALRLQLAFDAAHLGACSRLEMVQLGLGGPDDTIALLSDPQAEVDVIQVDLVCFIEAVDLVEDRAPHDHARGRNGRHVSGDSKQPARAWILPPRTSAVQFSELRGPVQGGSSDVLEGKRQQGIPLRLEERVRAVSRFLEVVLVTVDNVGVPVLVQGADKQEQRIGRKRVAGFERNTELALRPLKSRIEVLSRRRIGRRLRQARVGKRSAWRAALACDRYDLEVSIYLALDGPARTPAVVRAWQYDDRDQRLEFQAFDLAAHSQEIVRSRFIEAIDPSLIDRASRFRFESEQAPTILKDAKGAVAERALPDRSHSALDEADRRHEPVAETRTELFVTSGETQSFILEEKLVVDHPRMPPPFRRCAAPFPCDARARSACRRSQRCRLSTVCRASFCSYSRRSTAAGDDASAFPFRCGGINPRASSRSYRAAASPLSTASPMSRSQTPVSPKSRRRRAVSAPGLRPKLRLPPSSSMALDAPWRFSCSLNHLGPPECCRKVTSCTILRWRFITRCCL